MASLALLYDIHGNLPALKAVLADIELAGIDRYVLGGDYALFGPWPAETIEALRELEDAIWIRGNGERWTADPTGAPDDEVVQGAVAACRDAIGVQLSAELALLPEQAVLGESRFCHGSPISDVRSFLPRPAQDEHELLGGVGECQIVFGHTHLPFARTSSGGVRLVNPGSVGMPFDGDPRAAYAIVHDQHRVEHRRISYDHEASADAARERFGDGGWAAIVARRIASARF